MEVPKPRGIFSDGHLPREWVTRKENLRPYLPSLDVVCPGMKLISQLARSTNTKSFVLQASDGLKVCQFGPRATPEQLEVIAPHEEKNRPKKFEGTLERMSYLRSYGIAVPRIISSGMVNIAGEPRQYIVMDFIKGLSADIFLAHHPAKTQEVYYKFGKILGHLSQVPFTEREASSADNVLLKVRHASNFLENRGVLSLRQGKKLLKIIERRLAVLGEHPMVYVHLDPSPTNLQITGKQSNFNVTLMDVEAIQGGHPIIEGLGRAILWGIYDWNYITGTKIESIDSIARAFLDGYSPTSTYATMVRKSPDALEWLMETCRLVNLSQAIMYEIKKDYSKFEYGQEYSRESLDWSKETLLRLIDTGT